MKKILCASLAAAVLLIAVPSYGSETIKMLNDSTPGYSLKILEDGFGGYEAGTVLTSFCVEKDEYFNPGSSYYAVINTEAVNGGIGGPSPDPIDERSAYLYTQFISGNPTFQNQEKLQDAIWYIEQEGGRSNMYVGLANLAVSNGDWSGLGNVRVLNLYKCYDGVNYSGPAQDQLIAITPVPVPVPGAFMLAGLGTFLVGWIRRRQKD